MTTCALPRCNREAKIKYCSKEHGGRHRKQRQRGRKRLYCQKCGVVDCPQVPKSKSCLKIRPKALLDRDIERDTILTYGSTIPSRLGMDDRVKLHKRDIERDHRDTVTSRCDKTSGTKNTINQYNKVSPIRDNPEKTLDFLKTQAQKNYENRGHNAIGNGNVTNNLSKIKTTGTKNHENRKKDLPPIRGKPEKDQNYSETQAQKNLGNWGHEGQTVTNGGMSRFPSLYREGYNSSGGGREDPEGNNKYLDSWRWHKINYKINYDTKMDNGLLQILQDFLKKEKGLDFKKEELKNTFRIKKKNVKALNAKTTATLYYSTRSLEMRFKAFSSPVSWDHVKYACLQDFLYYCNQAAPILDLHNRSLDFNSIHINSDPEAAHEDLRTGENIHKISKDSHFQVPVTFPDGSNYMIWIDWSLGDAPELEGGKGRKFNGERAPDVTGEGIDTLSRSLQHIGSGMFEESTLENAKSRKLLTQLINENTENIGILLKSLTFAIEKMTGTPPSGPTEDSHPDKVTDYARDEPVAGYQ